MNRIAVAVAVLFIAGCSNVVHRDYHPETTYVQNVTYARHVWNVGVGSPGEADALAGVFSAKVDEDDEWECEKGQALACFRACYRKGRGRACFLLGVIFETGRNVVPSRDVSRRLYTKACELGDCSGLDRAALPPGRVTSPGSVVVYGDVYGNVVIGR